MKSPRADGSLKAAVGETSISYEMIFLAQLISGDKSQLKVSLGVLEGGKRTIYKEKEQRGSLHTKMARLLFLL